MVFQADIAFALGLIALGIGAFLAQKSSAEAASSCRTASKLVGWVIMISAVAILICVGMNAYKFYKEQPMRGGMMGHPMMRPGGMMMPQGGKMTMPGATQKPEPTNK